MLKVRIIIQPKCFRDTLLHGIPSIVSPSLLQELASLGAGDRIVLADLNFPAASTCRGPGRPRLVRADGHSGPRLLEAIMQFLHLDKEDRVPRPNGDIPLYDTKVCFRFECRPCNNSNNIVRYGQWIR